jgi:hypothetical protein
MKVIESTLYTYSKELWYGKVCRPWQKLQPCCVQSLNNDGEYICARLVSRRFQNVSLGLKGSHGEKNKN